MNKITIRHHGGDHDGEVKVLEVPAVTAETLARAFQLIFDRSFELVSWSDDGKVIFQCRDKDSGQEVMTLRDVAIVLGKTQKEVYGMIGNRAKQTATSESNQFQYSEFPAASNTVSFGMIFSRGCGRCLRRFTFTKEKKERRNNDRIAAYYAD